MAHHALHAVELPGLLIVVHVVRRDELSHPRNVSGVDDFFDEPAYQELIG
jgi:hypothetical protein